MLARRVVPCLDVSHGRVVKGVRFQGLRDAGDPAERAALYEAQGADEIVVLDVSATPEGRGHQRETVRRVREVLAIPLTVGGGIRAVEDIRRMLNAGADKVAINTAAVFNPELVKEASSKVGSQCIVVALDAKRVSGGGEPPRWEIFTHGGRKPTGIDAVEWAKKMEAFGAGEILLTSMDRDGTQAGYDIPMTRAVAEAVSIPVIASGGAGTPEHLFQALTEGKADAVLAASIFHYGKYPIPEVKRYLAQRGVPVRLDPALATG